MSTDPPDHRLVFSTILEGVFSQQLAPLLTPDLRARIKELGIDVSRPLLPAYRLSVVEAVWEEMARTAMGHLSREQALIRIGQMQFESFAGTTLGRATLSFFKVLGPDRSAPLLSRGFRQASNYVETKHERLGPHHFRYWFNDAGSTPEIFQGVLGGLAEMLWERPVVVTIAERQGRACWYEVSALQP